MWKTSFFQNVLHSNLKEVHNVNDDRKSQATERHEYESIDGDLKATSDINGSATQRHAASWSIKHRKVGGILTVGAKLINY